MKLSQVLPRAIAIRQEANPSLKITAVAYDSRHVAPGALFFAIPGFKADGHDFASAAVENGAAAVVTERWLNDLGAAQVVVASARHAMAVAAANFFGRPSERLKVTGVTGTNGKTTTTFLLDSILRAADKITGLVGGVEYRVAGISVPAKRTTPESPELQKALADMVDAGVEYATIEISSHGIDLSRAACISFDVAVFTNLTQDHLDLHENMESYYQTKRRLFIPEGEEDCSGEIPSRPRAAVNVADSFGQRLLGELGSDNVAGFSAVGNAEVRAADVRYGDWNSEFSLVTPVGSAPVRLQLPGRHNLENALAAAAGAIQLGIGLDAIAAGLGGLKAVPGRFDPVEVDAPFKIVIDYAHNEAGLERTLETARSITGGKLIVVFGCPGERDRDKRPHMGRIAGELADLAVLTTDDCYGEPPGQILDEAEPGLASTGSEYLRIEDRRTAIEAALNAAKPGDLVVIAGKGHETRQIMASGPVPFSDRETVLGILSVE